MKYSYLLPLMLIVLCVGSCRFSSQKRVSGNRSIATETRTVEEIAGINLTGPMDVYVIQATEGPSILIEGEENILPYIKTQVVDGILKVGFRENIRISTHEDIHVYVKVPELNSATIMGTGEIKSETLVKSNRLKLNINGSGKIDLLVDAPEIEVVSNGSGEVELEGTTRDLKIKIAGSGSVDAEELKAENVSINTAGSGDASVYASINLDVRIAGSGNIQYRGQPKISQKIVGSGSLRAK